MQLVLMNKKGFTLIEVIMVIVLFGIIMPGIMLYFTQGVKTSALPQRRTTAVFLAQALMEEIKSKRWDEVNFVYTDCSNASSLGSDSETRAAYDDIDDFTGLDNSPAQDSQGASMAANYPNFRQQVTVMYVASTDLNTNAAALTCYKQIKVTITDTLTNESIIIYNLMTKYARS